MKKLFTLLLIIIAIGLFADTRFFDSTDIPYRNKLEPFLNDHLETYLSPQNVSGNYWFVNASNTAGVNTGKTWDNAFTTITAAISAASANDVIFIAPGNYNEGDTLEVTQNNLKIIGVGNLNNEAVNVYNDSTFYDLMTVNGNNVEIAGISFTTVEDSSKAISLATTAAKGQIYIHDCRFDGAGEGTYGIYIGATYDSADLLIEGCTFRDWATCAIYANATNGLYMNNLIYVPASGIGIEHVPTTTARADQSYIGNIIIGANSSDVGIKITNTPGAGTYLIVENKVANCATTITGKTTNDAACILNYTGDASGGALIDPSP